MASWTGIHKNPLSGFLRASFIRISKTDVEHFLQHANSYTPKSFNIEARKPLLGFVYMAVTLLCLFFLSLLLLLVERLQVTVIVFTILLIVTIVFHMHDMDSYSIRRNPEDSTIWSPNQDPELWNRFIYTSAFCGR